MSLYLHAEGITKSYGRIPVLRGVSLDVGKGEIYSILGQNGAGKTTLIRILSTLLVRDGGCVRIAGYDLDRDIEQIRRVIGYVGQDTDRSAYARLTARENLTFFGSLQGLTRDTIKNEINRLCIYFNAHKLMDRLFMHLSDGQKQTVIIMRALLHNPLLLYLDEPTKGLDPVSSRNIREFLKRYVTEERKSMILTSHILPEVEYLADRVSFMHSGRITLSDTVENVRKMTGVSQFLEIRKHSVTAPLLDRIQSMHSVAFMRDSADEWYTFGTNDIVTTGQELMDLLRPLAARPEFRFRPATLEDTYAKCIGTVTEQFERL
ncbi:MAG: ABC transporter ATP-binding protein [Spirochaetota bacterium]